MIEVYFYPSPNGLKIPMMLEECGLPYQIVEVNILRGAQFEPEFLRISPNNRIPAIVDHDAPGGPLSIFESGAILQYLAEKSGMLLPTDVRGRYTVLQWLYWQVAGLGPMAGQAHHFRAFAPEKNVATKSSAIVQTMIGVEKTKRSPSRSEASGDSCAPPARSTFPEARIVRSVATTPRNDMAFVR